MAAFTSTVAAAVAAGATREGLVLFKLFYKMNRAITSCVHSELPIYKLGACILASTIILIAERNAFCGTS
jgi:hypothetical protein